ncbi:MAG TPA: protein kinase [Terriglobales bacterium]|jgi:non-specific serine/threonine protein kinase/serine/threonine-protein kinase
MKAERWQQVREIFERMIALPESERSTYLDQACAADAELRGEVESLFQSHEKAGTGFLKKPAASLLEPASPVRSGTRVGAYQIQEVIGTGGMGEVYRAARVDGQYKKEVAIKLVRGGFDTAFVQERFRHERQILATLDHPNIARLLDGGTTESDIPYLVMELIGGIPIDQYCDAHKLNITHRLELFAKVCAAVQYAHQRLVIHRDLKPSNIMVTGDGQPKLLDFGIAKILDPSAADEATLVRPMTPEYASPEQIRGDPITTASDVYSLGVVLYRLLTGRSPYANTRTTHQLTYAICETETERPSTAARKADEILRDGSVARLTPEEVAGPREGTPARLQRRLAGDLDSIVLKALRKESQRRYASVEQFAEDIRRHLQGLPVLAVKGSFRYRAAKFVRRNRLSIAAAAVVALSLATGIGATVRQARIARRQAEIARAEREQAEKRFRDVRDLANSLIFEIHDSIQALPGATPSRKLLLDRAVQYLDKLSQDAGNDPNLQRELAWGYQRLATVQGDTSQSNLGEVSAADLSNQKATALFEAVAHANPNNVTDQLNLAMAYRWRAFFDIYETRGLAEINRAIAVTDPLMRTSGGNLDVNNERAQELYILAAIQDAMGDRFKAIDSFHNVLDLRQQIEQAKPDYPGIGSGVAKVTVLLAHELGRFGDRDEGLRLMNAGIARFESLLKSHPGDPSFSREITAAQTRRGEVELIRGDTQAALADFQHARQRFERQARLDPENKMLQADLWGTEFQYGRTLEAAGKHAEALPILQHAFKEYQALNLEADVGPGPAQMQAWIAEAQTGVGNLRDALKNFQGAAAGLAENQANFDDARCDLAMVQTKIGNVLLNLGKVVEAEAEYNQALETAKLSFSLEHRDVPSLYAAAEAYSGLARVSETNARKTLDASLRSKLLSEARASYERSLNVSKHIAYPSRYTGGYRAEDPHDVAVRLSSLQESGEKQPVELRAVK